MIDDVKYHQQITRTLNPTCVCGHRWTQHTHDTDVHTHKELEPGCGECACVWFCDERELDDEPVPVYAVQIAPFEDGPTQKWCDESDCFDPPLNRVLVNGEWGPSQMVVCGKSSHMVKVGEEAVTEYQRVHRT